MGLITQISSRKTTREEKNTNRDSIQLETTTVAVVDTVEQTPVVAASVTLASPCPICRCPQLWFDRYGGGPHCVTCLRPPSKALVGSVRNVITLDDGSFAWEDDRASDAKPGSVGTDYSGGEPGTDHDFDHRYRCYTSHDGKREIIERRDWTFLNAMIAD